MKKTSSRNRDRIESLEEEARRYIWHPFTQMAEWEKEPPLIIERGKGVYLYDVYGKRYLDAVSSIWVNLHGHRKAALDRALKNQIDKIAHSTLLGLTNRPAIRLAKKLVTLAPPGLTKVFFSDNGSTAVEVALKIALQYWRHRGKARKTKFLSLNNAYHGDTIGSVSLGGIELFHGLYSPLLFPTYKVGAPYCYRCFLNKTFPECRLACGDEVERVLSEHHDEIAAVVIEPLIQGAAGMLTWPPGYLKRIRDLCTRYHSLLIADEVFTGFGRTGTMFACEHEGVTPDLMAVAKGLTGGYLPLAATLATREIYDAFLGGYGEFKTFFHGHSYTGNPLGCAVALASLDVFDRERVLSRLRPKIRALADGLKPLWRHPHVGDIRQIGLIAAVELVKDRPTKEPYPLEERWGYRVAKEALKRGMILRPLGNVVPLLPPLSVTIPQLRKMISILDESIGVAAGI
ncbi:MAG TPA: adenosylmethionine--8-amino-7-oxononanoate transaminase [Nitrospiria bacterium]|nr:adenosylmethionine--8-amino-7-oxononanoate transaminase [Nitrospiria bacterium]HUK56456.1 adenosylmethionine--8-amino-7-oxononanoate transaminase [Nitrospiria bacterium]